MSIRSRASGTGEVEMGMLLKAVRRQAGFSQEDLGSKLGISFQQIQKYEKGVNRIGSIRLGRIAEVLQVPIGFFYDTDGKHQEAETMIFDDPRFKPAAKKAQ